MSIHECSDFKTHGYLACMIGAPELILQRCGSALVNGQERPVDQDYKNAFFYAVNELANLGETVLAVCDARLPPRQFPPGFQFNPHQVNFPITGKGITVELLTEYRSIRCLNYVKFIDNTDNDFPPELNGII